MGCSVRGYLLLSGFTSVFECFLTFSIAIFALLVDFTVAFTCSFYKFLKFFFLFLSIFSFFFGCELLSAYTKHIFVSFLALAR